MKRQVVPAEVVSVVQRTLDAAFSIHTEIGPGCLERVYELALASTLREGGLRVERQVAVPFAFRGEMMPVAFRADLLIEGKVIVEVKATHTSSLSIRRNSRPICVCLAPLLGY